ncbi:MAG TPA: FAD-binding and (Fe-S)-binding domain-containing protein [Candidatus Limnocylindrales bacterium]|nr:FAD-binding and (Fe-S)-binding domain-containing protein [Candidatus Limnocylindrales bacterium]
MASGVETPPYVKIGTIPGAINLKLLETALRERVRGEVRFDAGSRALYATDGSNYRQVPMGVVIPRDEDDVVRTIHLCRENGAPVLNRGGATSLAGQCCNVAVVIDFTKYMHNIIELHPDKRYAWVQPGIINDSLRDPANKYGLTFGPDPATHNRCTVGGMIGNNSCGAHALMNGKTSENIEELEIITYEGHQMRVGRTTEAQLEEIIRGGGPRGEIYAKLKALRDKYAGEVRARYPKIPRRVSGYNIDKLLPEAGFHVAQALVGSESTLITVLAAKTTLIHNPAARSMLVLGYKDVFEAGEHIMEVLEHQPIGLEGLDGKFIRGMRKKRLLLQDLNMMPPGDGWLLCEFGGDSLKEADQKAHELRERMQKMKHAPTCKLYSDINKEHMIWKVRESGLGATAHVPGEKENWEGWEDSAVPPANVGPYLRDLKRLFDKYNYTGALYGHFGDGCIHTRLDFGLKTADGVRKFRDFISEAVDTVISHDGSLSGEHGDGQSRAEFLPRMFGPKVINAFNEFKTIWDPRWKMNPGKVVNPYRIDENLRYGPTYNPPEPETHFHFPEDDFSFAHAMERCVGVGECRRIDGGTMCPSYMATREEMHSTRGRARMLFEMLQDNPLKGGWKSEHVKEALDLCLSCKGCKGDCPVQVDMATYKSEFLSHYYAGRLRPRHAYASGLIMYWARLASKVPALANFFTHAPGLSQVAKFLAGYSQKRTLPAFAPETFKAWWRQRPRKRGGQAVVLWADTFTNHFQPEIAKAAVEVLEDAGCEVRVPMADLCCGRPLYDYGMLDEAKRQLLHIFDEMRDEIEQSIPVVVLEPSCATVFRDEMRQLMWGNEQSKRLEQQVFLLSEFLEKKVNGYRPPKLHRKVYVQGHCHHKSIMKMTDEDSVLDKMRTEHQELNAGCCGMAGAFGYEAGDHYEVSMACGERKLLPFVRGAEKDAVFVADGFSCREQIEQETPRKAIHLAQLIKMGLDEQRGVGVPDEFPERAYPGRAQCSTPEAKRARTGAAIAVGALAAGAAVFLVARGRR